MSDSNSTLPGVRKMGHREWFSFMAKAQGHNVAGGISRKSPLSARIDHGRWIADCPDCSGAECVTMDDPTFMCLSCGNIGADGKFRRVSFPQEIERKEIENLLVQRPAHNRSWGPWESIEKLAAENLAHGSSLRRGGGS